MHDADACGGRAPLLVPPPPPAPRRQVAALAFLLASIAAAVTGLVWLGSVILVHDACVRADAAAAVLYASLVPAFTVGAMIVCGCVLPPGHGAAPSPV
jgi:hypothetical protein